MERWEIRWGGESTKIVQDDHGDHDDHQRAEDRRQSVERFVVPDDEPSTLECIYD